MTTISRARVVLTGFAGGPGVATFYFLDTATAVASLHTLWSDLASLMPQQVQIQVQGTGDTLDDTNGEINGSWVSAEPAIIQAGPGTVYAAPSGMVLTWLTAGVVHGNRVRGRTFVVPILTNQYQGGGTILDASVLVIKNSCTAFIAAQSSSLVVWSRPFAGQVASKGHQAIPQRNGSSHLVTSSRVLNKVAVLRSRRD